MEVKQCVLLRWTLPGIAFLTAISTVSGSVIVGYDSTGPAPGLLYSVDAQTGAVAAIGSGAGIAMSSGPAFNTILYSSPVNTWELNVMTGARRLYACQPSPCDNIGDHAFDSDAGIVYALGLLFPLGSGYPNPVTALFRLMDSGLPYPGFPASTQVDYNLVGTLEQNDITVIEYVPGVGLVGTDGYHALYRIDTTNGKASLLTPLFIVLPVEGGITSMNGLAWDPDTRRLLGSAPAGFGSGGIGLPRLYSIDPSTGTAGWLNENPPSLTGIAASTPVPEPAPASLVLLWMTAGLLTAGSARNHRWSGRHTGD